ncbi:MAG: replication initiation protein [Bacteroides sp.]|nr:replication initiation protein [Bacteroides sp.]
MGYEMGEEKYEISKRREYKVVKDNRLINSVTRRKYELSALEQKALGFIVSMIKPPKDCTSKPEYRYTFDIRLFCMVCGIDYENGKNYENVKSALQRLSDNSFWINENGDEVLMRWVDTVRITKKSGKVSIRISDEIMPYLWNLQEKFTEYDLYQILALKSAYSIAFYELLKCNAFKKKVSFIIDELRKYLSIEEKYKEFKDLRRYVIEPSIKEINTYTDLTITWEGIRQGRSYIALSFTIVQKQGWEGFKAYRRTLCDLNGVKYVEGQANIFE